MYALVDIKGKQYKVENGSRIKTDKIDEVKGHVVEFDSVLMVADKDNVQVGAPYVPNVKVKAVIEEQIRDKKVIVFKYKRRKGYRKSNGHRQHYTVLKIENISV
jgi:large subunit ribosomal protein L21